ncbi:MAG TPA: glycosyltransferase family 39 protein [Planctomycetota bacterium]|nr:glycosyltransferase family 39 protein [Planctomycetota bacterium]
MSHPLRAVMAVVAALLFLSLGHGLPQRYVPDDHAVKCALGMARDLGAGQMGALAALVPPSGQYTTYPYLLPYADLAAISATFAAGRLTGRWHGAAEFAEAVFDDPGIAWFAARVVSALLTLLLPYACYRAARSLQWTPGRAALAALLAGSSLLVVQYAHTERPWAPLTAFGACALWGALRLAEHRRARDVVFAAVAAALSASTHPVGALFFGVVALAALAWRPRWPALAAGLAAGLLVVLCVGYPYLLVYRADTGRGMIAGQLDAGAPVDIGGQAFDLSALGGKLAVPIARAWFGYDPVLLAVGLMGLVGVWRTRRDGVRWVLCLPPLGIAVLFLVYDGSHVRYLLPATPFLALGAAWALGELASARMELRRTRRALAALALALPLVQAARLDLVLGREDTRTQAARELPALIGPHELVCLDGYGPPLEPTAASVRTLKPLVWINRQEERVLEREGAGVPEPGHARALLPISRFWKYDSYYPTDYVAGAGPLAFGDFLRAWHVACYVQVDRQPDEERRAPVTAWNAAHGRLVYELSPTGRTPPSEAALPTDMAFALVQLWRYDRPGPWIRCWRYAPGGA